MDTLLAAARLIHKVIRRFGPARGLAVLARYTMPCAWLICVMCVCAAAYDLTRGRRLDAFLWVAMAALSFTALWMNTTAHASSQLIAAFAIAAVVVAVWILGRSLRERFYNRPR